MTLALALLLSVPPAHAGSRWLSNDGFVDGSAAYFQGGFVAGECWGVIYAPEPDEYPFTVDKVRFLVGGSYSKQLFTVHFYALTGESWTGGTYLGGEGVAIAGNNHAWNELDVAALEIGTVSISSGNVGVSVCLEHHDGYPAIARDSDGVNANRNWIYTSGAWWKSNLFGLTGDWIQRICISGDGVEDEGCSDSGTGDGGAGDGGAGDGGSADGGSADGGSADGGSADGGSADGGSADGGDDLGELTLISITPGSVDEGEAVDVVLIGQGFGETAEARIGGVSIVGQAIVNTETIQGRTPTTLPAGVHDVEVVYEGVSAVLPGAFEVVAAEEEEVVEDEGCGCASGRGAGGGLLLAGLLGLVGLGRRRR